MSFVSDADVDEVEVESAIAYCCRLSSAAEHNHCAEKKSNREQRRDFVAEEGGSGWIFAGASESGGSEQQKRKERGVWMLKRMECCRARGWMSSPSSFVLGGWSVPLVR